MAKIVHVKSGKIWNNLKAKDINKKAAYILPLISKQDKTANTALWRSGQSI